MDNIKHFIELQRIDSRLLEVSLERPDLQRKADDDLNLRETINYLKQLQDSKKQLEEHLGDRHYVLTAGHSQLKALKAKEVNIKTNCEYDCFRKEVKAFDEEIKGLEREIAETSREISALGRHINDQSERVSDLKEEVAQQKKDIHAQIDNLDKESEDLERQRIVVLGRMGPENSSLYEILFEKREGVAVVPVLEGVCQGCMIKIMPWLSVKVMKSEETVQCPQCSRVLYAPSGSTSPGEPKEAPREG